MYSHEMCLCKAPLYRLLQQNKLLNGCEFFLCLFQFRLISDVQFIPQNITVWIAVYRLCGGIDVIFGKYDLAPLFIFHPQFIQDLLITGLPAGDPIEVSAGRFAYRHTLSGKRPTDIAEIAFMLGCGSSLLCIHRFIPSY